MTGGQPPKKRGRPRKDAGSDLPNYMRPLPDMAPPGKEMPEMSLTEADSIIAQAKQAIARSNKQIEDFDRAEQLKRAAEQDVLDEWRAHAPPGEIIKTHVADVGNVFVGAIERGMLNINPLGAAVNAGLTLGDLAKKIMSLEETIQMRKKGTPRERAKRAFDEGKIAWIERKAAEANRKPVIVTPEEQRALQAPARHRAFGGPNDRVGQWNAEQAKADSIRATKQIQAREEGRNYGVPKGRRK